MMGLTKARAANGQFPKGQSGNPGGRPRDEQKVAELARSHSREAIEMLAELMPTHIHLFNPATGMRLQG